MFTEFKEMRFVDGTMAQGEAAMNGRLEALKELAVTLLNEVEDLAGAHHAEGSRGDIKLKEEVRRYETELI